MKRLVVFSADAMVSEDLEYLKQLPNYKKYLAHASIVEKVRSVYPTITYPCHTTMLTGVWPNKHGILGNYQMIPGVKPIPWKWFYDWVKIKDDLFVRAKEAGYTTASVFWPGLYAPWSAVPCWDWYSALPRTFWASFCSPAETFFSATPCPLWRAFWSTPCAFTGPGSRYGGLCWPT